MTLGVRKLVVLLLAGGIVLTANLLIVAQWMHDHGVIDAARHIRQEFLTGTAVTIIVALLILLMPQRGAAVGRSCPVCDSRLRGGKYCSECGSRAGS